MKYVRNSLAALLAAAAGMVFMLLMGRQKAGRPQRPLDRKVPSLYPDMR